MSDIHLTRVNLQNEQRLIDRAAQALKGRHIVGVHYTTQDEAEQSRWMHRAIVIELDNGHLVWPASDDEGNDAGSLFTTIDTASILPRL